MLPTQTLRRELAPGIFRLEQLPLVDCRHLGPATGEMRACSSCGGKTQVKIFGCEIHSRTTIEKPVGGCGCCAECPDRLPPENTPAAGQTRHLLFHLYPRRHDGGSCWRWHAEQLTQRRHLFNGRKILAVVHDGSTDHAGKVHDAFPWFDEIIDLPNDPDRREGASFLPLFSRLAQHTGPGDVTLYAHGKGVTRTAHATATKWRQALYEICLDHWPLVEQHLRAFPVTGAFKRLGRGWKESASQWHYSGSWFWFRNRDLFNRNWRRLDTFWGAIEPYPSLQFTSQEAGCLFHQFRTGHHGLYDAGYWQKTVGPELERWRSERVCLRGLAGPVRLTVATPAEGPGLNLGCGAWRAEGWVNADVGASPTIQPDVLLARDKPLPWPDGHFVCAYLGHVLEHIPWSEVPALLAEVCRVVRPGGQVCVVGPDTLRVLERFRTGDSPLQTVREVLEDGRHYQYHAGITDWPEGRHHWNCYEDRVVKLLRDAGLQSVQPLPVAPEFLAGWPVVDYAPIQCAVVGVVP